MNPLMWFKCWMFGHEPDLNKTIEFNTDFNIDVTITLCEDCGATIVWDNDRLGWIKW